MKTKYIIQFILLLFAICIVGCKKNKYYEGEKDLNKIKGYNNENYYASGKMDSTEVIYHITNQKLQEIYDLAALAAENKSNKDIDTLLLSQLRGYFAKNDTINIPKLVNTLDSLKARYVKIELDKREINDSTSILNDSIGEINFKINFYDRNKKYFLTQEQQAKYILKNNPEKFKAEFKFYFSSIGKPEKK